MARFDAVLFDAGGVLVLPDPTVLIPLLAPFGGSTDVERHRRAHYAAMKAKADAGEEEASWTSYETAYTATIGVDPESSALAITTMRNTFNPWLWRWTIPETRVALDRLAASRVPMGVVSNASGQIVDALEREICQIGIGTHIEMRCIVDSHVVGVAKPDPAIFDHALVHFPDIDPDRIAYIGDSATMDVPAASGAGLHPILIDPYDDHVGASFERIASVSDLADELAG